MRHSSAARRPHVFRTDVRCCEIGALFAAGSDLDGPEVVDFIDGISTRVALMEALHLGKVGLTQAEMQLMPLSDLAQAILDARCAASGCSLEKPPPTTAQLLCCCSSVASPDSTHSLPGCHILPWFA